MSVGDASELDEAVTQLPKNSMRATEASAAPQISAGHRSLLALAVLPSNRRPARIKWSRKTLDAMAAGGIYDQIGGGFARYSTDERWLVPHFEKMLYDNASWPAPT